MSTFNPFGGQTYNLGTSIGSTDTTILLSSFVEPVTAIPYTMVLLNTDIAFGTIAPKTTSSEFISFTGITQNANGSATLTGVTRGLAKKYPFTTDAAYKLPHSGQTQFIISDAPQVFQEYVSVPNTQTIDGVKTFSQNVTIPVLPIANTDAASKGYADGLAIAGAPNATTTVKGIVELATQSEIDARTATGGTGASLVGTPDLARSTLLSDYKVDTGTANAYVITPVPAVSAYTTGQIFSFKPVNANTTASTLNVSGLGVKSIKTTNGSALVANDIIASQIVVVEYDGTNMVMINPAQSSLLPAQTGNSGKLLSTNATVPSWVASPKIFTTITPVVIASSTVETTLFTTTVPANVMGTTNAVYFKMFVNPVGLTDTKTLTLRLKYGGSTVTTMTLTQSGASSTSDGYIDGYLVEGGATNSQRGSLGFFGGPAELVSATYVTLGSGSVTGTSAVDSTASQTLTVTAQFNNSSAFDKLTINMAVVNLIS